MIKDIVVHLTGSAEDNVRLAYSEVIARRFDAHLTGLQVHCLPQLVSFTDPSASSFLQDLLATSHAQAQQTTDRLKSAMAGFSVANEIRRIDAYPGTIGHELAAETRTADLFVGTRPLGENRDAPSPEEEVLFESGRGCLFVPPGGKPPRQYGTMFVAWKDTREAARAVAEAMPFLKQAQQVVVGIVEEQGAGEEMRLEAGAGIGRYLSRHGVSAEIRKIAGWLDVGEALSNEASQVGADLIVMGGYGHSRFREWVFGGATRHMLTNATVPVLMAH